MASNAIPVALKATFRHSRAGGNPLLKLLERPRGGLAIVAGSFVLLAALGGAASTEEYRLGDLVVEDPWARELPPVSETGAAWFRVVNHGAGDHIVSVQSPVAERAELHSHEMEDGMARMRHLPAVEVPAHGELVFEPGARHVMLIGLDEPLVAGERFPMTIAFENAGAIEVQVRIEVSGEAGHGAHSGHSDHSGDSQDSSHFFDYAPPDDGFA